MRKGLPTHQSFKDYNQDKCRGGVLQCCFENRGDPVYGTLSHSHLLLFLLSCETGAKWKLDDDILAEKFRPLCNADGCLNYAAVAAKYPLLGEYVAQGMRMEVLS